MLALKDFIATMAGDLPVDKHREDYVHVNNVVQAPNIFVLDVEKSLDLIQVIVLGPSKVV